LILIAKGFQKVATKIGRPTFPKAVFTREHVNELVHSHASDERKSMLPHYLPYSEDFSWTTDFWTSRSGHEIMAVTAHGLDENFNMKSFFLGGRESPEAHTGISTINYNYYSIYLN
jgi:hypothetical protein